MAGLGEQWRLWLQLVMGTSSHHQVQNSLLKEEAVISESSIATV
jgi:hypothetical protein